MLFALIGFVSQSALPSLSTYDTVVFWEQIVDFFYILLSSNYFDNWLILTIIRKKTDDWIWSFL